MNVASGQSKQKLEQSGDAGADLHLSVSEAEFEVHPAESDADVSVVNDVTLRSRARKRKQNIQPSIPKNRILKGPPAKGLLALKKQKLRKLRPNIAAVHSNDSDSDYEPTDGESKKFCQC